MGRTRGWLCGALLLVGVFAPGVAFATQSAELYRTEAYFYGRFEARLRFAPGEGVVSSFFLWKDGSSSTTSWNELDYEKVNATCKLTTNIWTGKGTQSSQTNTPSFNVCSDYHTYAFEWTPDYISWLIDGKEIRKVTGASVNEYTQNASQGMAIHFNVWAGNSTFGGNLDPSTLPVQQFISWVQYSSYSNGAFQMQWREDFDGSAVPDKFAAGDWASPYNLSTHNMANVTFANGVAVLSMTADNATGFKGTPPADPDGGGTTGSGGASGTGSGGSSSSGGTSGSGGASATGGTSGSGGASATGGSPAGSGGTSSSGGASATGGKSASGGASSSSGGITGSGGGLSATGGVTGSGGESSSTGGTSSGSGGSTSGGTSSGGSSGGSASGGGGGCQAAGSGPMGRAGLVAALLIAIHSVRRRKSRAGRAS